VAVPFLTGGLVGSWVGHASGIHEVEILAVALGQPVRQVVFVALLVSLSSTAVVP
jgi:hypothetical protein